jgi:signal transduction histidine kinase
VLDLAVWLSRHVLQVLQWLGEEGVERSGPRDRRLRWRELSADSIAVAHVAAAEIDDDGAAAETYLFGLLHNAVDWLRTCGPRISVAKPPSGCLPSWLAAELRQRSRAARTDCMRRVMKAVRLWRESGRRGPQVAGVDLADVALARRRWRAMRDAPDAADGLLPALAERLGRLKVLGEQFDRAVEHAKLAALGELAYGASHEINNPLINISTRAQAMLAEETDAERRHTLGIINSQALRAHEMIADMMLFARPPEPVYERVNLVALADTLVDELAVEAEEQGVRLERRGATGELLLSADATQLAVALRAVCRNGLEAITASGWASGLVEVTVDAVSGALDDDRECARVVVRDNGPGIAPAARPHLFDPFFSGREAGRGLGLGLSKCWRVVTAHGGRIDVASRDGEGTAFTIVLPLIPAGEPPPVAREARADAAGPGQHVPREA